MKILVVSNYYPENFGGIEFVAHNLVTRYRQTGHQVRWMAADLTHRPHQCHQDDIPLKVINHIEEKLGFPYPLPYPNYLSPIIAQVRWCEVIHLHDCLYFTNLIVFLLSRILDKPVLVTQHVKAIDYKQPYKRLLQRVAYKSVGKWLINRAEQIIFVSQTVQQWFSEFSNFQRPPEFIPNGVDVEIFRPLCAEEKDIFRRDLGAANSMPIFLFVGRFVEKKGIHLLRTVIKNRPDWYWVLIGRPDEESPADWHVPNLLVLKPLPQTELRKYYAASHLTVLPSVGEGFPLSAQESLACGTPVMLCRETIAALPNDQQAFFPVDPDETVIQRELEILSQDLTKLEDMEPSLRQLACDEWSWVATSQQYLEFFTGLIKNNRG